ncbi:DNA methyltransferase [Lonsdalea britannica]|uniref:site-specific DNA-methyltransferase (adenine-specific) n=1 Tax=Lonsdalea britannica TaxID=1082704 RepID=A0AAD0SFD2_9GAMM|nr:site-specific DNA-methyltransferase [Lonsdalea britannica]AXW86849.1 site-specific DNA-methyltransferase [Lonsdalea britannica]OSM95150.1 DNA methyltransferase [Lonsdalea britannica]
MANKRIARHGYGHIENAESSYSIDALAERRQDECCSPLSDLSNDLFEIPNTTPNFRTELAGQLAEMVPEAVADGKLDVEKLRELLAEDVADSSERFGLFWPGKKRALRAAQAPTTATLKPDFANSKEWDKTQNVFIEGDNLEVLKILQRHYHNKIKLIYIDPPYNTGKDFVYPDNYKEGLDSYLEWTRQVNEEGKKVSTNSETEGRYHTNWLNMMYPRLKLARNLLADDGVIFISIDDHEADNLKKLCNEVFGEDNFVANIIWQKKFSRSNDARYFSTMHDHILCYVKSSSLTRIENSWVLNLLPRGKEIPAGYSNPDNDPRGIWTSVVLSAKSGTDKLRYDITTPSGRVCPPPDGRFWSVSKQKFDELVRGKRIWFGKEGSGTPRLKTFFSEVQDGLRPNTIWMHSDVGHNQEAKQEVKALFDDKAYFDSPKPVRLIEHILTIASKEDNFTVLDFFAGSATTAHAVMQLNAEDNGKRRFIMVQLPEPTPEASEARKAGFATIADISRKRIELAGEKIKSDVAESNIDTGFRAYKLTDTNFTKWRVTSDIEPDKLTQHLLDLRGSSVDDASPDDLLTELLLKLGYSLNEHLSIQTIAGLDIHAIAGDADKPRLLAYLNERTKPSLEQLRELVNAEPTRLIILEDAFHGDDELKTNIAQYARSKGIELRTA